jgi:hypothetical protein
MRKPKNILIFLFSLFYLSGCGQEKINPNFEQDVFIELLPKIVNSMFMDIRPIPLPPKEIRNEEDRKLKLKKWKEYKTSYFTNIPKYNTEFSIAIVGNMEGFENIPSIKIDFKKIKNTDKFIFKEREKFPSGSEIWKETLKYSFAGVFTFSRIKFGKEKLSGKIYVNYKCGILCGQGGTVYLKKELGKWIIERIEIKEVS